MGLEKFITMKIHVCVAKIRCEYLCFIFSIFLIHQCNQFYIFLDKIFKGRNDILNLCRRFIQIDKVSLVLQLVILVTGCWCKNSCYTWNMRFLRDSIEILVKLDEFALTDYFHHDLINFYNIQFFWSQNSEYNLWFKTDVELLHLNVATCNTLQEEICAVLWIKYV